MVTPDAHVRLHRIRNDQLYHYYLGDPIGVLILRADGTSEHVIVGPDLRDGQLVPLLIPGKTFHAARVIRRRRWFLGASTEWPGVEPADVEIGDVEALAAKYRGRGRRSARIPSKAGAIDLNRLWADVDIAVAKAKRASRLTLLGRSEVKLPASPAEARLETFPNPARRNYRIHFETDDFTSVCPITGQPDFARIDIDYAPDRLCVESKSLKFYLASYRNERAFNEAVTNRILDDFVRACAPREATVTAQFSARGGIALTVRAEHPDKGRIGRDGR
jgi:7-cyano-7-deazaguanine reductase